MQPTTAEKALTKSRPVAASSRLADTIIKPYASMNASTAKMTWFSTACPPILSDTAARGWRMRVNSRNDCLSSTNARIIFMPPPVEPEDGVMHDK